MRRSQPTMGKDRRGWARGGHPRRNSHSSKDLASGQMLQCQVGKGIKPVGTGGMLLLATGHGVGATTLC